MLNVDPVLVLLVAVMAAAWGAAGFAVCTARHKQRGLEVDSLAVLVPDDPRDLLPEPADV